MKQLNLLLMPQNLSFKDSSGYDDLERSLQHIDDEKNMMQ